MVWGGVQRKPNLKSRKRQRQVNSLKIYTMFQWLLSFHFPWLFKLVNILDPEGNIWRKAEKQTNKKQSSANLCDLYNSPYLVLAFEYLNELWSAFHYSPSGAVACFVQQFLVILAWRWLFCFMLPYFTEWKLPQPPRKKEQSWKREVTLKEFSMTLPE